MTYYIQNKSAGYLGNAIFFWGIDDNGYTANLDKSRIFTEEEARQTCDSNPDKFKAWPVGYIDTNKGIQRIVDSQYLDYDKIEKF